MNRFGSPRHLLILIAVAGSVVGCSSRDEPAPPLQAMPAPAPAQPQPTNSAAPAPAPALQGVIAGARSAPVAVLAEAGKAPLLVPEGALYSTEFRVEQVLSDRAVLRRQSDNGAITVMLGAAPAPLVDALAAPPPATPIDALPLQPPVPAAMDASGPSPGPGLTGPALPGPVSGG